MYIHVCVTQMQITTLSNYINHFFLKWHRNVQELRFNNYEFVFHEIKNQFPTWIQRRSTMIINWLNVRNVTRGNVFLIKSNFVNVNFNVLKFDGAIKIIPFLKAVFALYKPKFCSSSPKYVHNDMYMICNFLCCFVFTLMETSSFPVKDLCYMFTDIEQ